MDDRVRQIPILICLRYGVCQHIANRTAFNRLHRGDWGHNEDKGMISLEILEETYCQARQWKGCDWDTAFGPRRLNLCGLRSRHATVASKATRGDEAAAWHEAACWLDEVERDAMEACELGNRAIHAARSGEYAAAINWLHQAETIEQRYHLHGNFGLLRERMEQFATQHSVIAKGDAQLRRWFNGDVQVSVQL